MRAPGFWWSPRRSLASTLLAPAGWLYGAATAHRMSRPGTTLDVPVICIGNLVAGGAGKTPTALALSAMLMAAGHRPAILSRGYGRTVVGSPDAVLVVDPARHDASAVGDEPLLLSAAAPTYVSRDRVAAGRRAIADGATVLLLDDGLQNPALTKTVAWAVVDGATGIGNVRCLPAGPLRAPLARQWPFVSDVCVIGPGEAGRRVAEKARQRGLPVWTAALTPEPVSLAALRGTRLFAFAGIGHPAKFFASLAAQGLDVVGTRAFADHHRYTPGDLAMLGSAATAQGARLVTTAKDRTRLPKELDAAVFAVTLAFDEPDRLVARLAEEIDRALR